MNAKKGVISGMLLARVYAILDFKLSNTLRPSSIPATIEAKSSFNRIKSATSLLTSDPIDETRVKTHVT